MPAIDALFHRSSFPMKTITSRENPTYREALKLLRRKYREETGLYLLEGVKPVMDALKEGTKPEKLFLRGNGEGEDPEEGYRDLISIYEDKDRVMILDGELFDRLSDTENSQGVIALMRREDRDAEGFLEVACKGNILLLDRLQDPGNVGTVIRTAEAAGFTGIIALRGTADIYSPKVVRSAAGSIIRMPILTGIDEDEGVELAGSGGWKLAVSTVDGGEDCFGPIAEGRICLVVGNEGAGASEKLIEKADMRLMIPMEGEIESLNAAVAAGILMYRLKNRN